MRRLRSPAAFTLVEVLAALALTGLAVTCGTLLFRQTGDESARMEQERTVVSRLGNSDALLRALLRNAEASLDTAKRFRGDERSVTYQSWCATPSGWLERCGVTLAVDQRPDSSVLLAHLSSGEAFDLRALPGRVELRFLDLPGRDSIWVARWDESVSLPMAVALLGERDTLILPVGAARD
jgi:prepilin-type N-terminal cleavage/methylation domain-containing protein